MKRVKVLSGSGGLVKHLNAYKAIKGLVKRLKALSGGGAPGKTIKRFINVMKRLVQRSATLSV